MTRKKASVADEPAKAEELLTAKVKLLEKLTAVVDSPVERERVCAQLRSVRARASSGKSLEQVAAEMRQVGDAWLQQDSGPPNARARRAVDMHRALFDLRGEEDEQISEEINPDVLWDQSVRMSKKRVLCMTRVSRARESKRQKPATDSDKTIDRTISDEREYCRDNDLCELCKVPMRALSKESLLVCLACSRPQTAFRNSQPAVNFESEEGAKNVTDQGKTYRQFLLQFLEGVRIPDAVLHQLKLGGKKGKGVHLVARPEFQITRVRELMDTLRMREWLPYSLRITLQLLGREMPSLTMQEIELAVQIDNFMFRVHEMDPSADKTYPNAKRRSEMIFIWMGMPYFAKVFATTKVATKRSHFQLFDTVELILRERGFYKPS